jgi:hypothetical protein
LTGYRGIMAVMARDPWADSRLDDLNQRVSGLGQRMEAGFADMRAEFRALRQEMNEGRTEASAQFAAQNRMMYQLFGGMFATFVVGFLGLIAAVITHS